MKEWFTSKELCLFERMPNSSIAVTTKANRNNWLKRQSSNQGRAFEYHISNFNRNIQEEIIDKYITPADNIDDLIKSFNSMETPLPESNSSKIQPLTESSDWCQLPVFDVYAAAGAGSLALSEHQIGIFSIPAELLREFGLDQNNSSVIFVNGDSMEPTLSDKDRLLVDITERQHPAANGVYVIRIDDAIYVKRLEWDIEKGHYNVISDNPKHKSFHIDHNNGRNFKILGKAIAPLLKKIL